MKKLLKDIEEVKELIKEVKEEEDVIFMNQKFLIKEGREKKLTLYVQYGRERDV